MSQIPEFMTKEERIREERIREKKAKDKEGCKDCSGDCGCGCKK